jgi:hypothetical protein
MDALIVLVVSRETGATGIIVPLCVAGPLGPGLGGLFVRQVTSATDHWTVLIEDRKAAINKSINAAQRSPANLA